MHKIWQKAAHPLGRVAEATKIRPKGLIIAFLQQIYIFSERNAIPDRVSEEKHKFAQEMAEAVRPLGRVAEATKKDPQGHFFCGGSERIRLFEIL